MRQTMLLSTLLAGAALITTSAYAGIISTRLTSGANIQTFGPSTTGSLLFNTTTLPNFSLISGTITGAGLGNNSTLLDINSLQVASTTGGPLTIAVTETGLTSRQTSFVSAIGGTFTSGNTLGFQTYIDAGNTAFATTTALATSNFATGNNFSNSVTSAGIPLSGLFSETLILTVAAGSGSTTSFDANMGQNTPTSTVPEPASMALLGGSLAVIGLIRRKKA